MTRAMTAPKLGLGQHRLPDIAILISLFPNFGAVLTVKAKLVSGPECGAEPLRRTNRRYWPEGGILRCS